MKKLDSAAAMLIIAALLAGIVVFTPKVVAQSDTMYAVPASVSYTTATAGIGTLFNVSVWCTTSVDLGGAQVYMEFNDTIINCTRDYVPVNDSNFFYSPIAAPTVLPPEPNPSYVHLGPGDGRVMAAVCNPYLPCVAPWGHAGLTIIFEFNITAVPTKSEGSLSCALHIDDSSTYLLGKAGDIVPGVTITDGSYQISWVPVPDVNHDGKVNLIDAYLVALSFGTVPGDERWNPDADINGDGQINLQDYYAVCLNFGK